MDLLEQVKKAIARLRNPEHTHRTLPFFGFRSIAFVLSEYVTRAKVNEALGFGRAIALLGNCRVCMPRMHKDLESNPPKRDKDSMLDRRRRRFLCPAILTAAV